MNHTPGPWEVMGPWPSINVCVMVDGGCGGECPEPPIYEPVCVVHQSVDFKTEASDKTKADAYLIAAAPELLKACKTAACGIETAVGVGSCNSSGLAAVHAILLRAIAKAESKDTSGAS